MSFHKDLVGTDLHGGRAFTGIGTPVGTRTAGIIGELYFDTFAKLYWVAHGLTVADWTSIGPGAVGAHAPTHKHGGGDEVATAAPGANEIPKAGGTGTLAPGWLPAATEAAQGAAEIATQAETDAGTDDVRIVTPLKLRTDITSTVRPEVRTDNFGVHSFGPFRDYSGAQGSPQSANEIQYMRVWLRAGVTITSMRTFIAGGADGVRQIQFGIYDQTAPTTDGLGPNNRVANTASDTPPNLFTGVRDVVLTSAYLVPTTGWYHFALQASSAAMLFLLSDTHRAGTIPRREETPGGFMLPSPAGATTQPQSAALYCAGVE